MTDISTDVTLGEVIIIGGLVCIVGYGLYKAFGSIGAGLNSAVDSVSQALSKAGSAASGAVTLLPGGSAVLNTPPSIPGPGVPVGYDWTTGQVNGNQSGAVTMVQNPPTTEPQYTPDPLSVEAAYSGVTP